jgi:hypothetical protein
MIEGGLSKNLSVKRASDELRKLRPHDRVSIERIAAEFLHEVRRSDRALHELHDRIDHAVKTSGTLVTKVFGVGPIVACYLMVTAATPGGSRPPASPKDTVSKVQGVLEGLG